MKILFRERSVLSRALLTAIAVMLAVMVNSQFSTMQAFWVPLTVVLMVQITIRATLRQIIFRLFVMMLCVGLGSLLLCFAGELLVCQVILVMLIIAAFLSQCFFSPRSSDSVMPWIVALVFSVFLIPVASEHTIYARLHDVALGGVLGIAVGLLVFSVRADKDFRRGVVPVLLAYREYLLAIKQVFFAEPEAQVAAERQKRLVETVLQSERASFPEWVYAEGFAETLRQGHRHFLVRIEQLGEVLFVMHYIARHSIDKVLREKFHESVSFCVQEMTLLMHALVDVLELKKTTEAVSDLSDEIAALEKVFQQNTPLSLELLDTSPVYLDICAFIYALKDLQTILLQLTKALR